MSWSELLPQWPSTAWEFLLADTAWTIPRISTWGLQSFHTYRKYHGFPTVVIQCQNTLPSPHSSLTISCTTYGFHELRSGELDSHVTHMVELGILFISWPQDKKYAYNLPKTYKHVCDFLSASRDEKRISAFYSLIVNFKIQWMNNP